MGNTGNKELDHKAMGLRIRKQRTFLNLSLIHI